MEERPRRENEKEKEKEAENEQIQEMEIDLEEEVEVLAEGTRITGERNGQRPKGFFPPLFLLLF